MALTALQLSTYERDGFLCPLPALEPQETERFRRAYEALSAELDGPRMGQAHLHLRWAYELATHDRVLDAVEAVIGGDILVHGTTMFMKPPRSRAFVSWHQDAYNWRLDEPRLATAWIALSPSTRENGCLRVIPGSQGSRLEHDSRPHDDNMLRLTGLSVRGGVDESAAVALELEPGQISLHHADLVHGSNPNRSEEARIGFAVRYISPATGQAQPHHPVVLARGSDDHGNYELLERPPDADIERGLAAHAEFWS